MAMKGRRGDTEPRSHGATEPRKHEGGTTPAEGGCTTSGAVNVPIKAGDPIRSEHRQSFPFATHYLQCPVPVGELPPRGEYMVRIDGTITGRRAKALLSVSAASIANRWSEKKALDLLLDIFADAMGY